MTQEQLIEKLSNSAKLELEKALNLIEESEIARDLKKKNLSNVLFGEAKVHKSSERVYREVIELLNNLKII